MKLCTLDVQIIWIRKKKLNIKNWLNSMRNCVHYMYGWSRFAEKLNIQNSVNSMGNCAHYM